MDFRLVFISVLIILTCCCSIGFAKCSIKSCSEAFLQRTQPVLEDTDDYCIFLYAYSKCLSLQDTSCRGDLNFYGTQSAVDLLIQKHVRCTELLSRNALLKDRANILATQKVTIKSNDGSCRYSGGADMSHCALFGDPHLVTFNAEHQTCIIKGAWPLFSTEHLAIQVTNEPFAINRMATTVTKVTVVIKSVDSACGSGVTYEASDDLPRAFVDGRMWTQIGWVNEVIPGKHVVVNVPIINATVGIRKINNFHQVLISLPTEVAIPDSEDVNLCITGCPFSQQVSFRKEEILKKLSESDASVICSKFNLTDEYLDSCMFDLMTTGDEAFGETASLAQKDMSKLNARYVSLKKNCTQWPCEWSASRSSLSDKVNYFSTFILFLVAYCMR